MENITGDEYRAFLEGLGLETIRLESSSSECSIWEPPSRPNALIAEPIYEIQSYHPFEDRSGFGSIARTGVTLSLGEPSEPSTDENTQSEPTVAAYVEATYLLVYSTNTEANDELIEYFLTHNLSLHVWPYAREFVQNMISRFGWPPYLLPPIVQDW